MPYNVSRNIAPVSVSDNLCKLNLFIVIKASHSSSNDWLRHSDKVKKVSYACVLHYIM